MKHYETRMKEVKLPEICKQCKGLFQKEQYCLTCIFDEIEEVDERFYELEENYN